MTTYLPYRAKVYCNLGHLIDGQFADTYLQQSGLIFCRGTIQLAGLYQPDIGAPVEFAYTRSAGSTGTAARLPRKLLVLSSFANPLTNVTTVRIGCRLSLLQNKRDLLKVITPADSYKAESPTSSDLPEGTLDYVSPPISASYAASRCLQELGIVSVGPLPLNNKYTVDEIDFTTGYVNVLEELLRSEMIVGFMNDDDALETFSLLNVPDNLGPVINETNCFTLSPNGPGELPAEQVTTVYAPLSLKPKTVDTVNDEDQLATDKSVTYGFPVLFFIPWEKPDGGSSGVVVVEYVPVIESKTKYDGERRPVSTVTTTTKPYSAANPSYVSQLLSQRLGAAGVVVITSYNIPVEAKSETTTTYDKEGRVKTETNTDTLSPMEFAGSLGLNYLDEDGFISWAPPLKGSFIVQQTITEYSYTPTSVKREVKRYQNWCVTQSGQYLISSKYNTSQASNAFFNSLGAPLIFTGTETTIRETEPPISKLPGPAELTRQVYGKTAQDKGQATNEKQDASSNVKTNFEIAIAETQSSTEFRMPFTPNSFFRPVGNGEWESIDESRRAQRIAFEYGKIQNRLLLGNVKGSSMQIPVELMPVKPFDPIYLQFGGLTGQYRANGMSWTFDQNGIVGQVDALFWLAIGQDASPGPVWFPVAPGVTVLPTTPGPTVNTTPAPANSASVPAGWNPAAPDLGALFGALPTGVAPVFPTTLDVAVGLEPFNETVEVEAMGRAVFEIEDLPYSLTPQEADMDLVGASVFVMEEIAYVAPPAAVFRLTPQVPFAYVPLQMSAAQFRLVPQAPEVKGSAYVEVPPAVFRLSPQVPLIEASGRVNAPAAVFSFSPEEPTVTGDESSGPTYETVLFLEMQGTNGSTTFVDSSIYDHEITAYGNAQVSNNELLLDGDGDWLLTEQNDALRLGTAYFRIEGEFKYEPRTISDFEVMYILDTPFESGYQTPKLGISFRPNTGTFEWAFTYDFIQIGSEGGDFLQLEWGQEDAYVEPGVKVSFALVRDENGTSLELNGARLQTNNNNEYYAEPMNILGNQYFIGIGLKGTIDNFKILTAPGTGGGGGETSCADAPVAVDGPNSFTTFAGSAGGGNLEMPATDGCGDAHTIYNVTYFSYTAATSGVHTFSLCGGSDWDTRIAVLNTCDPEDGVLGCNDDFCDVQSQTTATLETGMTCKIVIGGFDAGSAGPGILTITAPSG